MVTKLSAAVLALALWPGTCLSAEHWRDWIMVSPTSAVKTQNLELRTGKRITPLAQPPLPVYSPLSCQITAQRPAYAPQVRMWRLYRF